MHKPTILLLAAFLTFFIAGCKQADAPAPVGESSPARRAAEATKANSLLSIDPAELPTCDKRTRSGTVRWDTTKLNLSPPFEIWVSYPNKEPRLFVRSPSSKGEKQTGKWVIAGISFSLKNSDGSEIGNVSVAGIPCD